MLVLGRGSRGSLVGSLQRKLKELGFGPSDVDGVLGQETEEAITAFQRSSGIPADGIAGPQVLHALNMIREVGKPTFIGDPPEGNIRTKVFISYSRQDARWLKELQKHLTPLEEKGVIIRWDDTIISPGQDWHAEINDALKATKVAVLLVSENFMASKYVRAFELPALLGASDEILILPVIISPCYLGELSRINAVNSPSKTISEMTKPNQARVWLKLVETIIASLEKN